LSRDLFIIIIVVVDNKILQILHIFLFYQKVIDEADRLLNQSYNNWLTFVLKPNNNQKILTNNKIDEMDEIKELNESISMSIFEDAFSIPKTILSEKKISPVKY
jgi:hypothetical protein